jgi:hypothetical protein
MRQAVGKLAQDTGSADLAHSLAFFSLRFDQFKSQARTPSPQRLESLNCGIWRHQVKFSVPGSSTRIRFSEAGNRGLDVREVRLPKTR